jgi:uncharacterized lipoprotein YehR (DUF1307 family)
LTFLKHSFSANNQNEGKRKKECFYMKKIFALVLAAFLALSLAACGEKTNGTAESNKNGVVGSVASEVSSDVSSAVSDMSSEIIDNESERESEMSEKEESREDKTSEITTD